MYHRYTRSHVIPDIVHVPINLSSLFCVPLVHKTSCDLKSLCPYELVITILCTTGTQDLMQLYTFSSCHNRFLSSSVLIHQPHALNVPARLTTKKNYKSNPLVMKPVGSYRNIKHIALFSA